MKLQRMFFARLLMCGLAHNVPAQTTTTTEPVGFLNVQGVLHENGQPVNGFMDFCWGLFLTPSGGTRLATDTNMNNNVLVSNGVANVTLNVGHLAALGLSPTQELYLELDLRRSGTSGEFTALSPRQRVVPSMFATSAVRAEEARRLIEPVTESLIPPSMTRDDEVQQILFALDGSGSGLDADTLDGKDSSEFASADHNHDDIYWRLEGNAGTTPGVNFLGTTDSTALEVKVNLQRALRLEPNATAPNVIAGSSANAVSGAGGVAIGGGHLNTANGLFSVIGGGTENLIDANAENSTISGGRRNTIQAGAARSTIGGGATNTIQTSTDFATIGGGVNNNIFPGTSWATIGGGRTNVIRNGAAESTIGGGGYNLIENAAESATIAGGYANYIDMHADYSSIGGGNFNLIIADSSGARIGGGTSNRVDQAAAHGTISGGYSNTVGQSSGTIGGGETNQVLARLGTIGGGGVNVINIHALASTISGGQHNIIDRHATNSVIAGGNGNLVHTNAHFAAISGGRGNHVGSSAPYGAIPGGREAKAFNYGQIAHASGGFSSREGTAQESFYVVRGTTTDTNNMELFLDGVAERIRVPPGSTWTYDVLVTARSDAPGSAGFHIRGTMGYNPLGNLVQIGTPIIDQFGGGSSVTAQVVADNGNKAFAVTVRWGQAGSNTVRWVAAVRTVEVVF